MTRESPGLPFYKHLYFQVIVAIALAVLLGRYYPDAARKMRPLGDAFIRLIKMMIAPIIFATVVVGIAKMGEMREVGRVGLKALVYFELVSTLALAIGLIVVNVVRPGVGVNADVRSLNVASVIPDTSAAKPHKWMDQLIPTSFVGAFTDGEILHVLLIAILFGLALLRFGEGGRPVIDLLDRISHVLFGTIGIIMKAAPIGAFGAMAYTVGAFGFKSLASLGELMACVYLTCALFVAIVLGGISWVVGFRLWDFLRYIEDEIVLVLGTSSSEAALPRMITKLEALGCSKSVVNLVVPTGYSFNLDGTSIYLTMAAIFVAQATNVHLTLREQLSLLAVLLLTSKGAAAVTGGGFITLAATLSATGGKVPVAGLALLLGIDRFMSEARAITNLIGNGVATVAIAAWEGALDRGQMQLALRGKVPVEAELEFGPTETPAPGENGSDPEK